MANHQPSGPMRTRGRTRDYTIPVRLNNQSPRQQIMSTNIPQRARARTRRPRPDGVMQQLVSIIRARQIIPYLLAMIVVVIASTKVQQSHCDTKPNSIYSSSSLSLSSAGAQAAAAPSSIKQSKPAISKVSTSKSAINSATTPDKKQNERLLAALSENIERQHIRQMANSFMKKQQRPSKFDSGDVSVEMLPTSGSFGNHQQQVKKSSGEQALNDIMRMHEQPSSSSSRPLHYTAADSNQLQAFESLPQPAGIKSSSNKIVTQLLSYIVRSPLTEGAAKLMLADGNSNNPQVDTSSNTPKLHLRPFTGRSNAGTPNTSILHKPFLALPNWIKSKSSSSSYSTKPSTMFGDDSSRGWTMLSPANQAGDLIAADSNTDPQQQVSPAPFTGRQQRGKKDLEDIDKAASTDKRRRGPTLTQRWLKNQLAQNYLQDSFRGLLTLSQLPILPVGPVSTAPSVLEPRPAQQKRRTTLGGNNNNNNNKQQVIKASETPASVTTDDKTLVSSPNRRSKALEDLYRYAYILGTSMIGRKRDPLKALSTQTRPTTNGSPPTKNITQRSIGQLAADNRRQMINLVKALQQALFGSSTFLSPGGGGGKQQAANPRGVMWDMATDPTLVVTLMHMIEKASVALPLGFLLMPIVQMIRMNPLGGVNLNRMLPVRALHRSVEHELLAKRLDAVDKVLSRALRQTHREATIGWRK